MNIQFSRRFERIINATPSPSLSEPSIHFGRCLCWSIGSLTLLPLVVMGQTYNPTIVSTPGVQVNQSGATINANATGGTPAVVIPGVISVTNDDQFNYSLNFDFSGVYSYANPFSSSPSLFFEVSSHGYQIESSITPNGFVNGGPVTVTTSADVTWSNAFQYGVGALNVQSIGSDGYPDNDRNPPQAVYNGNDAGTVSVDHSGSMTISGSGYGFGDSNLLLALGGIYAVSEGGTGASGQTNDTPWAGPGGAGESVTVTTESLSTITMSNTTIEFPIGIPNTVAVTAGIVAASISGDPAGNSGPGGFVGESQPGGSVTVTHNGSIDNSAPAGIGILATSIGGAGGTVSYTDGPTNTYYGESAAGGPVNVTVNGSISMTGAAGVGVLAASTAGDANISAYADYSVQGETATVTINSAATISTGSNTNTETTYGIGVLAISSGTATVLSPFTPQSVATSGNGYAGDASIYNYGTVSTGGEFAIGLAALGIGGSGIVGTSGEGFSYLGNSSYVYDSKGSEVSIENAGSVTTVGPTAHAIVAISSGGGGLMRISRAPVLELPSGIPIVTSGVLVGGDSQQTSGSEGDGFDGSSVIVTNSGSITTGNGSGGGIASVGIVAQSIGGGGGTVGGNHEAILVGDSGGVGGNGGAVTVTLNGATDITTKDLISPGVLAQSIGGGGGNGANAAGIFVATGGNGGNGGDGGAVTLDFESGSINTSADHSPGLITHSIGGGGGNGGAATSLGLLIGASVGGSGGGGGSGGEVNAALGGGTVTTTGNQSHGLIAQSIGGGGGTGGAAKTDTVGVVFSMAIALGGTGGDGGNGAGVAAMNNSSISTGVPNTSGLTGAYAYGADSHGMLVQSIGGGGGHGGNATATSFTFPSDEIPVTMSFDIALGGQGGSGGSASEVMAYNAATASGTTALIQTLGDGSHGIAAQSIGGGGGNGGDSTASAYVIGGSTVNMKVALGMAGSGAMGGSGGEVLVANGATQLSDGTNLEGNGVISTTGQNAVGILAQSIGGGGGNGGTGNASTSSPPTFIPSDDDSKSYNLSFAFGAGGAGGQGNSGGAVAVTNVAGSSIITQGSGAQGIVAQSIASGGGYGGGGSAGGSGDDVDISLSLGGSGGIGDSGGSVTVTNDGLISTMGGDAHGILAHSIGGGGGAAGSSDAAASINTANQINDMINQPNDSYQANIAIGSSGGGGGNGGSVTVTNNAGAYEASTRQGSAGISTQGVRAHGILAQSIAGGGGAGGAASSTSNSVIGGPDGGSSGTYSADIAVGGSGGTSGDGGTVTVSNTGVIQTTGYSSAGILAHSVGGGGGIGGEGTVDSTTTIGLGAAVSNVGDTNGNGGAVTISNSGWIFTENVDSPGILAQSIGGGGGVASSGTNYFNTNTPEAAPGVNMTLGLSSGYYENSFGGQVNITHTGGIVTQGDWSHGIIGQSIGGGGGKASSFFTDATTPSIAMTLGLTGEVGITTGGNGGNVYATLNDAIIITGAVGNSATPAGYSAYGVLLQSIGGSGGLASDGSLSATDGGGIHVGWQGYGYAGNVTLSGADSNGNATQNNVTTYGEAAHAVVLQAIGGSGGIAGQGSSGESAGTSIYVKVGGIGSEYVIGDGGTVTLQDSELTVNTFGDNAYGILAQSIGGGGGLGFAPNGPAYGVYVGNGGVGDGGSVTLTLEEGSAITTSGDGAHAILAQSIGGGGGIAQYTTGTASLNVSPAAGNQFSVSEGDGGQVSITSYDIATSGASAYGILAQSIGGGGGLVGYDTDLYAGATGVYDSGFAGAGGGMEITQNGELSTTGENSIGVFAQSDGYSGAGQISINVNGSITGGSGDDGAGIVVVGGTTDNAITIADGASVGTVNGQSGVAIHYFGDALLNVTNNGTVVGSVNLANSSGELGAFTNNSINTLFAGPVIAADVVNNGRFFAGLASGAGYQQVHVLGDFTQTPNGILEVNANFLTGESDQLLIDGDTLLDGVLRVNANAVLPGANLNVLAVGGTINGNFVSSPADSPLITYRVQPNGALNTSANFAPAALGVTGNQHAVASHLQGTWTAGGSAALAPFYAQLNNMAAANPTAYNEMLAQLSPGTVLGLGSRRIQHLLTFGANALNGARFEGDTLYLKERPSVWFNSSGYSAKQTDTNGLSDYRLNHVVQQMGGQFAGADGWFYGGAAAYEYDWLDSSDGKASADGNGAMFAAFVKYQTGDWLFTATGFGGFGFYDSERSINLPTGSFTAKGSPEIYSGGGMVNAAYAVDLGQQFYFRPNLSLGVVSVHSAGYTETGAGLFSLDVESATQTSFVATPAVELGARVDVSESVTLRPYLGLGLTMLTENSWDQDASFVGAPVGSGSFTTSIPVDDFVGRVSVGLAAEIGEHWALGLRYDGDFSESVISQGGSLNCSWDF